VGWLVALGAVVAVGVAGRGTEPRPREALIAQPTSALVTHGPTVPGNTVASPGPNAGRQSARVPLLVVEEPAVSGQMITSRDLVVRGSLSHVSGPVRVTLESRNGKPIAVATAQPVARGRREDDPRPVFEVRLALPGPRPNGTMVVQVVVFDIDGIPRDAIRRRIRVGAVEPGGAASVAVDAATEGGVAGSVATGAQARPRLGEDGLMGGITFGTAWP